MDKAPCAGTEIHLYRGADSTSYQRENDLVLTYFKGHEEAKKRLRKDHPDEFNRIKRILDLRKRHMRKDVPIKYIFCLSCCYEHGCIHPLCQDGAPSQDNKWYPNGPPLSFIPVPAPDPKECNGQSDCEDCKGLFRTLLEIRVKGKI